MYRPTDKTLLDSRNAVFVNNGMPALLKNGFQRSPFPTSWHGRDDHGNFSYEFCRLNDRSDLEIVETYIARGDKWIKVYLNIFKLIPTPVSLAVLQNVDGLAYHLPPNSETSMRLRVDDHKGPPIFHIFSPEHKLGTFYSPTGLERQLEKLRKLIEGDLNNIDHYIESWHRLYKEPATTNWQGIR